MSEVHKGRGGGNHPSGGAVPVGRWLPIVGVLGSYRRAWLMRDVVAAVTVCAVLVPQALAYGQLAGLSRSRGSTRRSRRWSCIPCSPARGG